ncbi:hypothetical protein DUY81_14030 [Acidipropionibacterium acidipropionici]|uniref:Uncharacterized protein n=1 Tax=Acidipropionibacterium acidipropionici TaxID=1748 RepID=A0AAC8YI14_9ACTN|nr:hypothetical protein AXH35_14335 [Acidipropionibacterium acidipropionici]AOZ47900.1 hypothetical protein A8L58_15795 [Acidipropionibacterium acidipropionici]AZP38754.1 hypothetical protein DUY81_14030 [Acidipropionibacterium acidipropionici]
MMDTIWIRVAETGKTVEVGRSAGNGMIFSGHAVQVAAPDEDGPDDPGPDDYQMHDDQGQEDGE